MKAVLTISILFSCLVFTVFFGAFYFAGGFTKKKAPVAIAESTPIPTATPAPIVRHLTPEGTYLLIQRVSITTDSGIVGFKPGTKVYLVKDLGDNLRVSAEDMEFEVPKYQLTNDIDFASLAGRQDSNSQRALSQHLHQQKVVADLTAQSEFHRQQAERNQILEQQSAAPVFQPTPNPLDLPAHP